jgi:NIMA (never in mitosis gene a)-related kinase
MHIVMEYASGGTLHKRIEAREGELFLEVRRFGRTVFSEYVDLGILQEDVWEMFVQIVMALRYVHSCNVLHRDMKTQNIMLAGLEGKVIKVRIHQQLFVTNETCYQL